MRRLSPVLRAAAILFVCALSLFPLYWIFVTSVTPKEKLLDYPPALLPTSLDFQAYSRVLLDKPLLTWMGNSVLVTVASMALALAAAVLAAYSLSRFMSPLSSVISFLLLSTRMIPGTLLMVPLYIIFREWGLLDTKIALIIAYTTFEIPFATWMLKGYFDSLPQDLERAAEVDGCSPLGAFFRVSLPLAGPGIAASAVASAVLAWSDYEFARALVSSQSNWPLTVGIHSLFGEYVVHWNDIMASSLLSALPVVALFLVAERYIVSGLTAGAIKS